MQVGTWVPNPYNVYVVSKENAVKYYNQVQDDTKDTYEVRWYVSRGNSGEIANVELREQDTNYTDKFQKVDGTYEDMLKYSSISQHQELCLEKMDGYEYIMMKQMN